MAGLLGLKQQMTGEASSGLGYVEGLEQQQEMAQEQLDAQAMSGKMSLIGSGVGVGAMVGGPVGAAVGGGLALIASLFQGDIWHADQADWHQG